MTTPEPEILHSLVLLAGYQLDIVDEIARSKHHGLNTTALTLTLESMRTEVRALSPDLQEYHTKILERLSIQRAAPRLEQSRSAPEILQSRTQRFRELCRKLRRAA